jgi:UPF0755 protein
VRIVVLAISVLAFLALGALSYGWYSLSSFLTSPAVGTGDSKVVDIPENATLEGAVSELREHGLLPRSGWLDLYVDHLHERKTISPGEYAVSPAMTPVQQIELLESGNVVTYTVAVEAGMSAKQIIELLGEKKLGDTLELERLVNDPSFAHSLGIAGPSLEGFLHPDIYDLPRRLTGAELLERFVSRHRNAMKEIDLEKVKLRGHTEYEVMIIASLIEAADVKPEERRFYAAMIYDRLKEGIALAHKKANDYGADWDTVDKPGLPPTPIASPSLDAIRAAANPAPQHVLYMAPRDDGTHVFCPDPECYLEAFKKFKGRYPKGLPRRFPKTGQR